MVKINCWLFNKEGFLSIAQNDLEKEQMIKALGVDPVEAIIITNDDFVVQEWENERIITAVQGKRIIKMKLDFELINTGSVGGVSYGIRKKN